MRHAIGTTAACAILALGATAWQPAQAQLGSEPLRMVMPFGPGGGTDITTRILAATAPEFCGARMDVISMTGAGGLEALDFVIGAEPDGHTLLVTDYGPVVTFGFTADVDWTHDDWVPILQFTDWLPVVYTRGDHDIDSIDDWVERAREAPDTVTFAHALPLGITHLPLILFEMETGIQSVHVPTTGGGENRTMILGGHVDLASTLPASIAPEVADGSIKALGVFADERSDVLPEVPTMKELGYDVSLPAWLMVFAHKDVPEETQALLENCFLEALATPSAQSMSNRTGADIVPRGREEAGRLYRSTIETVGNVLREIGEIE